MQPLDRRHCNINPNARSVPLYHAFYLIFVPPWFLFNFACDYKIANDWAWVLIHSRDSTAAVSLVRLANETSLIGKFFLIVSKIASVMLHFGSTIDIL